MTTHAVRTMSLVLALLTPIIGLGTDAVAAGKIQVKSEPLTGYQETPGVSSAGSGAFRAEIDEDSSIITFEITYTGLAEPATVAHIHFGNRFTAGGVAAFFCGGGGKPACPAGTTDTAVVTGTIVPADIIGPAAQGLDPGEFSELVQAIRAGVTYVNVHNATFPAGEIRGQVNNANQRQP